MGFFYGGQETDYFAFGFHRLWIKVHTPTRSWALYYRERTGYFNSLIRWDNGKLSRGFYRLPAPRQ